MVVHHHLAAASSASWETEGGGGQGPQPSQKMNRNFQIGKCHQRTAPLGGLSTPGCGLLPGLPPSQKLFRRPTAERTGGTWFKRCQKCPLLRVCALPLAHAAGGAVAAMLSAELLSRAVERSVAGAQGHAGWATHLGERECSAPQQHLAQLAAWRRHTRRAGRPPWREMDPAEVSLR